MKIRLLKLIDKVIGRLFIRVLTALHRPSGSNDERILVIRPGGIGDAVLLIPAIKLYKEKHPEAHVTVLAENRNGAVFSLCPAIDSILLYDAPKGLLKAIGGSYDAVIDTEQWHRLSAVVARLTGAPLLVGYGTNERRAVFSHAVAYSHDDYEVESFFNLFEPLGIEKPARISVPFLKVPRGAAERVERILGAYGEHPYIAIFPGATVPERRWGMELFREVARRLRAREIPVVVVGGRDDAAQGGGIVAGTGGMNLAGRTSLVETAAVIAGCAVLLSGDSGILHIGVGLGKPTVSLFGPGIAKKWAPRGEEHVVINKNLPCSPCTEFGSTPKCPINARCMSEISVEEVTAAVMELYGKYGKKCAGEISATISLTIGDRPAKNTPFFMEARSSGVEH